MVTQELRQLVQSTKDSLNKRADAILQDAFMQPKCAMMHAQAAEQFEAAERSCYAMLDELSTGTPSPEREQEMRKELRHFAALLARVTVPEALSNLARAVAGAQCSQFYRAEARFAGLEGNNESRHA